MNVCQTGSKIGASVSRIGTSDTATMPSFGSPAKNRRGPAVPAIMVYGTAGTGKAGIVRGQERDRPQAARKPGEGRPCPGQPAGPAGAWRAASNAVGGETH